MIRIPFINKVLRTNSYTALDKYNHEIKRLMNDPRWESKLKELHSKYGNSTNYGQQGGGDGQ